MDNKHVFKVGDFHFLTTLKDTFSAGIHYIQYLLPGIDIVDKKATRPLRPIL